MFLTTPETSYTNNWVKNVGLNGTFIKNSLARWNLVNNHGIPGNWTVETADE